MFEIFPIKCISIIIDIAGNKPSSNGKSYLPQIKESLIQPITKLESDDLIYVYSSEGELEMNGDIGEPIGAISNFRKQKIDLHIAIQESWVLIGQYDNCHRAIFVVTDNYRGAGDGIIK